MSSRTHFEELPDPTVAPVVEKFRASFAAHADELAHLAMRCTGTPLAHHREEVGQVLATLQLLLVPRHPPHGCLFRSRGRVLVGLPANEPLVTPVILACAALLGGNEVQLRPASRSRAVMERILALLGESGVSPDRCTLLEADKSLVEPAIRAADHVVWLGSSATCRHIAAIALDAGTTFTTEAEGFDIAIIDAALDAEALREAARHIVASVTYHDGQACRALRAVLVPAAHMDAFRRSIDERVLALRIGPPEDPLTEATLVPDVRAVAHLEYPASVPFTSRLEIVSYTSDAEVADLLDRNPFGLSTAFFTTRPLPDLLSGLAGHARVGRLLVNVPPRPVDPTVPWGGFRRTGSGPHDPLLDFVDVVALYRR